MDDLELNEHVRDVWKTIAYLMDLEKDKALPVAFRPRLSQAIEELSKGGSTLGDLHNDMIRVPG